MPLVRAATASRRSKWGVAVLALLAACGGDGERQSDSELAQDRLAGTASSTAPVSQLAVNVMAANGLVLNRRTDAHGRYESQPLTRSPAPYLLQTSDGPSWASAAVAAGWANINPLTTLVVAQLVGERPEGYFYAIAPNEVIDFPAFGRADLDAAQTQVIRRLRRQFGLSTPAAVESFIETPYVAAAGDPVHELLLSLDAALARTGTAFETLVDAVAAESLRCRRERVTIDAGGDPIDLCPAQRSTALDPAEPGVIVYRFESSWGDALSVRARGGTVLDLALQIAAGARYGCVGTACAGVALGPIDSDGRRVLTLGDTKLTGPGAIQLAGRLITGEGPTPADCAGPKFSIRYADARVELNCVGARSATVDFGRDIFGFNGRVDASRRLELRLQAGQVVWVALLNEGSGGVEYRCKNSGCQGVVVGEADAQGRRPVSLDGLVLQRANNDGSVVADDTARVTAALTLPTPQRLPTFCPTANTLDLANSDGTVRGMCSRGEGDFNGVETDEQGRPTWFATATTDGYNGALLSIEVDMLGTDRMAVRLFDASQSVQWYGCEGAACAGLAGSVQAGRLVARFDAVQLREIDPDGGVGDRHLRLDGWVRTPPAGF